MRHFAMAAAGLWLSATAPAFAQSQPVVVVELYTSQGCSSCPPADAFMEELVANPAVIPLALHVDYWDYIGWKDVFAQAAFTERQKAYAYAIGSRTIYTPQMIVAGDERIEGHNPDAVRTVVDSHLAQARTMSLVLQRNGDTLSIAATAGSPDDTPYDVHLVRYKPAETVEITRGENAGRTLTYHNIVTDWQVLGQWTPDSPLDVSTPVTGPEPVVVILQRPGNDVIVAAARLE